ncbi:MAG: hypothetical protein QM757_35715 [Paludibaculum sp.]
MSETNHGRPDENDLVRRVCRDDAEAVSAFYCEFLLPVARVVVRHFNTRVVEERELANSFFLLLSGRRLAAPARLGGQEPARLALERLLPPFVAQTAGFLPLSASIR